jgi:hypothetical protein
MSKIVTNAPDAREERGRARLSDADRAWMMSVSERELAQGKITIEEYEYVRDRCRVSFMDTLKGMVDWLKNAIGRSNGESSPARRSMTPRRT